MVRMKVSLKDAIRSKLLIVKVRNADALVGLIIFAETNVIFIIDWTRANLFKPIAN